jgi:hypothetical protein
MTDSGRWRDPRFLLCVAAALLAFAIQSGELGTADTMHRLQTTHWLWTSQPQVFPNEYPEFGLPGRGGKIYSWYGIGQSLLMLPADVVATWVASWKVFAGYQDDPAVRSILVSYSTNILLNVLTALIAFRFLRQLGFAVRESAWGVLALLFCTTHLHYTQNLQENNYILLLTFAGFSYQYEWLRTGSGRALWLGSGALGLNLLTRVTTVLDIVAAGLFVLILLWRSGGASKTRTQSTVGIPDSHPSNTTKGGAPSAEGWGSRLLAYGKVAVPVYIVFGLLERLYSWYRFGSFTQTYIPIFARVSREQDPTLPANFPWSTPFHEGFLGALFKPEKSIFLFDPLLVLALILIVVFWKRMNAEISAYAIASIVLLVSYISFYARYTYWAGDFAWGDRYVSSAVEMVAMLSVPLLLKFGVSLGRWAWSGAIALIIVSFVIQIASLMFWLPLEIYQMETLGHPTFVIALRFKNIVAFALGKMNEWGLDNEAMHEDSWDYVHITTWNFLPFLLRRVGASPRWVVDVAFAVWITSMALLAGVMFRLRNILRMFD